MYYNSSLCKDSFGIESEVLKRLSFLIIEMRPPYPKNETMGRGIYIVSMFKYKIKNFNYTCSNLNYYNRAITQAHLIYPNSMFIKCEYF